MSSPAQKRIVLQRSERAVPANATDTGRTQPQQTLTVSLIVKRRNPLHLEALGGRTLSRDEFDAQYAADPASFEALRTFAHQHGLAVDETASSLPRRTLVLRGPARAMEQAFGVELHDYREAKTKRRYHSFTGPVSLPESHVGLVDAVLGLDARPVAKPHFRFLKNLKKRKKRKAAAADPSPFNPPQVAALYGFPAGVTGAGQTIALIELGGGYTTSDIQTYFSGLGLTPPTVVAVSVDGGTNAPGDPNGADGEVALDIQVAGSIANGARIAVYFAPNTDQGFIDAITTAVHDTTNKPSVISISWGGPESSWVQTSVTALDDACQSAGALGVTITVASGDNGSSDGVSGGGNHVDFPASSPYVLACGGTELVGTGTTIAAETVWNDGTQGGATGGGYSAVFPLPSWQTSAGITGSGRGVPDVAGDASPESGYNILVDGQQEVVGGTSAVAPLWAALLALINQKKGAPAGFVNPTLYPDSKDFRDITQGNNGAYKAGPGWDACTGLGSPNGAELAAALG
ncbi:MAG TPA: S53 family peptidase [Acidobacteriaceae bacterium]|jgi:kumamolisin|nr:S53 family peptidase [Acidobacteriaceae bacterium]